MEPTTLYYLLAVLLVLVGIAGTILPALPGLPLVFAGMLLAAWAGDFQQVGVPMLVVLGLLTVFSLAVDFWATALGAKRVGASGVIRLNNQNVQIIIGPKAELVASAMHKLLLA